jgi:hypothetical protein
MSDKAVGPKNLVVQPVVVPRAARRLGDDRWELSFYVVFTFRASRPDYQLPSQVRNAWPELVDSLFGEDGRGRLLIQAAGAPAASKLVARRSDQVGEDDWWSLERARRLWSRLVTRSLPKDVEAEARRSQSPVVAIYESDAKLLAINPSAASDLRPAYRLESLNSRAFSVGSFAARIETIDPSTVEDRNELNALLALAADPRAVLAHPTVQSCLKEAFVRSADKPFGLSDLLSALRTIPDAAPQEELDAKAQELRAAVVPPGHTEVVRFARIQDGSQNREPVQQSSRPDFLELTARFRQHPGLCRRLFLAVPATATWAGATAGKGRVAFVVGAAGGVKFQHAVTVFDLGAYSDTDGREAGYFRASPADVATFLGSTDPVALEVWRRYSLMPGPLYWLSQESILAGAARAAAALPPPPAASPAPTGKLNSRQVLADDAAGRLVNAVNIYAGPTRTTAEILDKRLRRVHAAAPGQAGAAEQFDPALSPQSDKGPASGPLFAEDLMQGVTIFVRSRPAGSGANFDPWAALGLREVEVFEIDKDGQRLPLLRFTEEAGTAASVTIQPKPTVGTVSEPPGLQGTGRSVKVRTVAAMGTPGETVAFTVRGRPAKTDDPEPSVMRGAFHIDLTPDDIKRGDYVRIVPATRGSAASEVALIPPLLARNLPVPKDVIPLSRPAATAERKGEVYPLLLTRAHSRFVTAAGAATSNADAVSKFEQVLVEGERRTYMARTFATLSKPVGVRPLPEETTLGTAEWITKPAVAPAGVVNPFTAAPALQWWHLSPRTDRWRVIDVPGPAAPGPWGTPLADATLEQVWLLTSSPLASVRGRTTELGFELTLKLTTTKPPNPIKVGKFFIADAPNGISAQQKVSLAATTQFDALTANVLLVRLEGSANPSGGEVVLTPERFEVVSSFADEKNSDIGVRPPALRWVLRLVTASGEVWRANCEDKHPHFDKDSLPIRRPTAVRGRWIELIGVPSGRVLAVRGWPQDLMGTLVKGTGEIHDLLLPDASRLQVKAAWPLGDRQVVSGFVPLADQFPQSPVLDGRIKEEFVLAAGEVTRIEVRTADTTLQGQIPGVSPGDVLVEVKASSGAIVTLRGPAAADGPTNVAPIATELPGRLLRDMEIGEFSVARGHFDTAVKQPGWIELTRVPAPKDAPKWWRFTTALVGRLSPPDAHSNLVLSEGTASSRPYTLDTLAGVRRTVWWHSDETVSAVTLSQSTVMVAGSTVVLASTISEYKPPPAELPVAAPPRPVHAIASELIARWDGWSLAVPAPGRAHKNEGTGSDPKPYLDFSLRCYRPDLSSMENAWKEWWRLPALRFGREYQLCLRRADLAGNHVIDEHFPPSKLPGAAFGWAEALVFQELRHALFEAASQAKLAMADAAQAAFGTLSFKRADRPAPPALAFAKDAYTPTDAAALGMPERPLPREQDDLQIADGTRDETMWLVTDVRTGASDAQDARAVLLPPPCAVETVLMHGVFDRMRPDEIASQIRLGERYVDHGFLGVDSGGILNYLADPAARRVAVWVRSGGAVFPRGSADKAKQVGPLLNWNGDGSPKASLLRLEIDKAEYVPSARHDARAALPAQPISVDASASPPRISVALPPGVEAEAVLAWTGTDDSSPPGPFHKQDEWRSVPLVHVLNGPRSPGAWERLEEVVPIAVAGDPPPTTRTLSGSVRADLPTTGWYTVTGYWNDPWDERQSAQFGEAEVEALTDAAGAIRSVRVADGGFGYGNSAVVVVEALNPQNGDVVASFIPPVLEPVVSQAAADGNANDRPSAVGTVAQVLVHDGGQGFDKRQMCLRVIRRPPFHRSAEAGPVRTNGDGALVGETVSVPASGGRSVVQEVIRIAPRNAGDPDEEKQPERGGFYASPPFVVAHDSSGQGYGARLRAQLDGAGGVAYVEVLDGGTNYGDGTYLRFYTNRYDFPEQSIAFKPDGPPPAEQIRLTLVHPLDTRGRPVDYVVELAGRFRKYLLPFAGTKNPTGGETVFPPPGDPRRIRFRVPRVTPPRGVDFVSMDRPRKPSVAYLMPSFVWVVDGKPRPNLKDARKAFVGGKLRRLTVHRHTAVRVYLRRPWHGSGPETLGVAVAPAIQNTVRQPDATQRFVDPKDSGVLNVRRYDGGGTDTSEPLEYHVLAKSARAVVSRWGFDPAWHETALPPLNVDHFPARIPREGYEWLGELDAKQPAVALAVHAIAYDAARELWYADIPVDLRDDGRSLGTNPFVQLAVTAFQENGLPGRRVSPVVQCDMIKLGGERTVEVNRSEPLLFSVTVGGGFEIPAGPFPRRSLVAELNGRPAALAADVVTSVEPGQSGAPLPVATYPLAWRRSSGAFAADIRLDAGQLADARARGSAVLSIKETETYLAAEGRVDGLGEKSHTTRAHMTADRVVFALTFDL